MSVPPILQRLIEQRLLAWPLLGQQAHPILDECYKMRRFLRRTYDYRIWRSKVFASCDYRCVDCRSIWNLDAHHLLSFKDYPRLRFELKNGLVLCRSCHEQLHGWKFKAKKYCNPLAYKYYWNRSKREEDRKQQDEWDRRRWSMHNQSLPILPSRPYYSLSTAPLIDHISKCLSGWSSATAPPRAPMARQWACQGYTKGV